MKLFPDQLRLRALSCDEVKAAKSDVPLFEFLTSFRMQSNLLGIITVPVGYQTDFASIPRAVWSLLSPDDVVVSFASTIHDRLYFLGGTLEDGRTYTREQADQVFIEGMADCGATSFQQWAVYHAVRLFGGSHFHA
jgi:hypothetical protein